jgi:hypothetical protein
VQAARILVQIRDSNRANCVSKKSSTLFDYQLIGLKDEQTAIVIINSSSRALQPKRKLIKVPFVSDTRNRE